MLGMLGAMRLRVLRSVIPRLQLRGVSVWR